ncbi:MAG: hypothetical protein A2Y67_02915 [Candidatus Buchananbacteria bacterium RBG_13_39_9]|uniref:Uncharacterized protein n=1 Tax=Candidatus Buchananbacteria bacterium RBG_13_39_9 TaxID=1797531 RepID=A0A1G1XPV8_9BACT|nr:MAG: hypothetical protein A2Y67_02915 [Candidatus Buchananbacteria bacterium RBG_13_39_9]
MAKRQGCRNSIFSRLANFSLIVDGNRLLIANADLAELEQVKTDYEEKYPGTSYIIENFGVETNKNSSSGGRVREWKKTEGYSLWQAISP